MYLSEKSVLVTGADGFIGSHLVEALRGKCGKLTALCMYNSFNSWGNLEDFLGTGSKNIYDVNVVLGDVRDPHFCVSLLKGVDIVFNLAALIAIPYSYTAPQSYIETNVTGALNICEAARANNVSLVVQMSTSEVYGTAEYVPIDERHQLKPQSPYSASKIGADSVAKSFWYSFGLPVIVARPFNTYGPRQSARAFIPTVISQIAFGEKQIRLGDTAPTRDLNYVADTCAALITLAGCDGAVGETVNIGTGNEASVGDVFKMICELMGADDVTAIRDEARVRPKGSEVMRLLADNRKLKALTGFSPSYSLFDGLRLTVDWIVGHKERYKPDVYNV